jgi:hypothetical protein
MLYILSNCPRSPFDSYEAICSNRCGSPRGWERVVFRTKLLSTTQVFGDENLSMGYLLHTQAVIFNTPDLDGCDVTFRPLCHAGNTTNKCIHTIWRFDPAVVIGQSLADP